MRKKELKQLKAIINEAFHEWGDGYGYNGDPKKAKAELLKQLLAWHEKLESPTFIPAEDNNYF